ncbi:tetraspanin [Grosmannia clavigera kw1407]|uniref:Tetraspanin n=1 Tax=Grosmannia clavigera (strain kw1407 / UAMH 11150) TaxID=655863 RepID=F0XT79_GROCL|nr:tetraspanin [Grosmannia clavigera kw1407]EFW99373.1 tetraspanin [Grosmannia clavigera kw1407]
MSLAAHPSRRTPKTEHGSVPWAIVCKKKHVLLQPKARGLLDLPSVSSVKWASAAKRRRPSDNTLPFDPDDDYSVVMANKIFVAYVVADALFIIMGSILLGFSVVVKNTLHNAPSDGAEAARNLLYTRFPLTAGVVNGIFYFITFVFTIPAVTLPTRGWLKLSGYMVTFTALFSLGIGLRIWITTLNTKEAFSPLWNAQTAAVQDLMQTQFQCCGYFNSTSPAFVTDATCSSPAAAALVRGCASQISSFGNTFVDEIFTAVFGMCGICALLVMATACLLKDRKERERFRYIDEKNGLGRTF